MLASTYRVTKGMGQRVWAFKRGSLGGCPRVTLDSCVGWRIFWKQEGPLWVLEARGVVL